MPSLFRRIPWPLLAARLLAGCAGFLPAVGPDHTPPALTLPAGWTQPPEVAGSADLARWWQQFADPQLDALIDAALADSLDLRQAEARLRQARAARTQAVSGLFPSLTASAGASRSHNARAISTLPTRTTWDAGFDAGWVFHLNPKARFSDGSPVTAADVKFSFDIFQSKSNFGLQMYLSDLAKTEVLSKYSVKMHFKTRNNVEMPLIVARMPIYSKKDWQGKDFSQTSIKPI